MHRRHLLAHIAAVTAAGTVPEFWRRAAQAAGPDRDDRTLVVVELNGGNDGLNTVIPFRDDRYHQARPTLRIPPDRVLKLDDTLGLHPALTELHGLWGRGKLRVAMNVGYPTPSRSHFRALEVWQSAEVMGSPVAGWLGRLADAEPGRGPACFVGPEASPLAVRGRAVPPVALNALDDLQLAPTARLGTTSAAGSGPAARVAELMANAHTVGDQIHAMGSGRLVVADADNELEGRLGTIGGLIRAGFGSRVYYTSLGGFDTHAGQEFGHASRLRQLAAALARFQAGLEADRLDDRVVVLVFSEFGRRVAENGTRGTDHGAAAPVFVLGTPVVAGILGGPPDLANLDDGDIRHQLDFRRLYAAILGDWLGIAPGAIVKSPPGDPLVLVRS